jgi:hypothetical protein
MDPHDLQLARSTLPFQRPRRTPPLAEQSHVMNLLLCLDYFLTSLCLRSSMSNAMRVPPNLPGNGHYAEGP